MCFQDNSLFPHFNVTENINIGAKRKNGSKFNYSDKDLIKILHLEGVQEKYPHQISSGEAQRVSLARSLLSRPDLLLLDEPFANIDTSLKEELQKKIKDILKEFNITTIIVTHDSYEAFFMGDKCGILLDQSLKQYDEPYNIHHEPNSLEVAKFLNRGVFVDVKVVETDSAVHSLNHPTLGEIRGKLVNNFPVGTTVKLLLRLDFKLYSRSFKNLCSKNFKYLEKLLLLKLKKLVKLDSILISSSKTIFKLPSVIFELSKRKW